MKLNGHTILVTGGSSGIGMQLAARLVELGNEVIVTGRRKELLDAVQAKHPKLHVRVSDAGNATDREALAQWVVREFPTLDVLVNNAGIQRKVDVSKPEAWSETASEIDINLGGPIHMSALLHAHLRSKPEAHIMNVSSGLAFVPLAHMPVYCATKAALHSFSLSLREQLKKTSIQVTEIIPPAVKTNLGGSHDFGEELDLFVEGVLEQIAAGKHEVTFGPATAWSRMSRDDADQAFRRMHP